MKKMATVSLLLVVSSAVAWGAGNPMNAAQEMFKPIPFKTPNIKDNPSNPAKVDLGMKLFFDPRLSNSQLISCNTCHNLGLGGADLQETSIGHGWQKGPRNAPTVFNAVYNVAQFWDGRAADLKAQAVGPVQASVEMNNNPELVVQTLKSIPGYTPLFWKAFPGEKNPITFANMAKAIEAFEATLVTPDAPFDRYLKGDRKALTAKQEAGLRAFIDNGCVACHGGINVGGSGYFPFGLKEEPSAEVRPANDMGRFKLTNTEKDKFVFRAPSLRNVAITQPYFHSGRVWTLKDAVGVMSTAQLGINLTAQSSDNIVAFLESLTGKQPKLQYPILPPSTTNTPHPTVTVK
ncbi:cytochrome-c peroxidase [Geomonas sp.]|uniref:cytochrome-c peroxidase n=1 Tax=Geomonas sp. TaxID=2651584 RepID=UPI002B49A9C8|nr:cytochrome-c peroxidase [Geomonas sp.]HJV33899.1 cytochrome-c peroxidase [Geomonas sp.]